MKFVVMAAALFIAGAIPAVATTSRAVLPVVSIGVYPGDTLTAEMVLDRELVVRAVALRSFAATRDAVVGKVARRALAAGQPIPLQSLRDPHAFKEGQSVTIVYGDGGLMIQGVAVALEPGVVGQQVRMRNAETGITVRGTVRGDGTVTMSDTR